MTPAGEQPIPEQLWAHHAALLAIPAIVPAVVLVAVILYIARKDRREEREEREIIEPGFGPGPETKENE
jgi:hypothetical protein